MTEVKAKVRALVASGMDPDMVVDLIIDVVARGLGRLGGRPRNGSPRNNDVPNESGGNAPSSVDAEVTKPVCAVAEPVSVKGGKGGDPGSSLQLFSGSHPDASLESSSDRRSDGPKYSAGFLRVCAAYPKGRVGSKSEAWRSWGRHGGAALEEPILAALSWQVVSDAWLKDEGAFVPHLCRYISKRRHEDDRPPPRQTPVNKRDEAWSRSVKGPYGD